MNKINKNHHSNISFSSDLRPGYSAADVAQLADAVQRLLTSPKGLLTTPWFLLSLASLFVLLVAAGATQLIWG